MKHFWRHFFIPHQTNNHRAKALHLDSLLAYVLLLTVFNLGFRLLHRAYPEVLGYATDIRAEVLLSETNSRRQAAGLPMLILNGQLTAAAIAKAQDMFSQNYWAHNNPAGKTPWDFIVGSGYRYALAGENLAKNFSDSNSVVEAWMNSPTHRANILKSGYREIGFGIVNGILNGEETTLVVQMFGTSSVPIKAQLPPQPKTVIPEKALAVETKPVLVEESPPVAAAHSVFSAVAKNPLVNIPSVAREIVFLVVGLLVGALTLDGWWVARRHVVRLTGHNLAHIMFLTAIVFVMEAVSRRGSLL